MLRKTLLVGLSTAAMSVALAGTASAQNTQGGNCSPATASGTVTPNGNSCTTTRGPAADANNSTINVTGTNNTVSVTQNGILNTSTVSISGDANEVTHLQDGSQSQASTSIVGSESDAIVRQSGSRAQASLTLSGGSRSSATIEQGRAGGGAAGAGGDQNVATLVATGNNLLGQITQNSGAGGNGDTTAGRNGALLSLSTNEALLAIGANNYHQSATITQRQNGNSATVRIAGGLTSTAAGGTGNTGQIITSVTQENTLVATDGTGDAVAVGTLGSTPNPLTNNFVDISATGTGHRLTIEQDGTSNYSSVSVIRGGSTTSAGTAQAAPNATTAPTAPAANTGFNGLALDSRTAGNRLDILQDGRNMRAQVSIGGRDAAGFQGRGNIGIINQGQGTAALIGGVGGGNGAATATTTFATRRDHSATLFQFGTLSSATIRQDGNVGNVGVGGAAVNQSGSSADVSQSAFASFIELNQTGTNSATISQGAPAVDFGGANTSGNNRIRVSQIDAGNTTTNPPASGDPFGGGGTGSPVVLRNTFSASQAGRFNDMTVRQNGFNVSGTVFQTRGTTNAVVELNQGAAVPGSFGLGAGAAGGNNAGDSSNMTANIEQGGSRSGTGGARIVSVLVRQDGNNVSASVFQNNSAFSTGTGTSVGVSQVGSRNNATVTQTGSNAIATVDQRGQNGTAALPSVVTITQQGGAFGSAAAGTSDAGNRAVVRQASTVGASSADSTNANFGGTTVTPGEASASRAGAQATQAVIFQQITGDEVVGASFNSATIEQNGRGQYAEIDQRGRDNEALIQQGVNSVNSVAIIRQTGNMNDFFISQTTANQFFRAVQTGGNNQVVTSSAPNGGSGGTGSNTVPAPSAGFVAPGF